MAVTDTEHVPATQFTHDVMDDAAKIDDHVPAVQDTQLLELATSDVDDHVPDTQEVHAIDPAVAHVPKLHEIQAAAEVAALVVDHMPAAHDVQDEDPIDAHDPGLQEMHTAEDVAAAFPEAVPATQLTQTDCEVAEDVEDHVPALQALHVPALSHVPIVHVLVHVADPGADTDPLLQFTHVATDVAATDDENVPELHRVQDPDAGGDHVPVPH